MSSKKNPTLLVIHHAGVHGGANISMCTAVIALSRKFNVVVAHPSDWVAPLEMGGAVKLVDYGASLALFPFYSGGASVFSKSLYRFLWRLQSSIKKVSVLIDMIHPDLIYLNSITLSYLRAYITVPSIKWGCFVRETVSPKSKVVRSMYGNWLKLYDIVFFLSRHDRSVFSNIVNGVVLYNTFNSAQEIDVGERIDFIKKGPMVVLYTGGDSYIKGYYNLLRIMKRVYERDTGAANIQFILCGQFAAVPGKILCFSGIRCFFKNLIGYFLFPGMKMAIRMGYVNVVGSVRSLNEYYRSSHAVFLPIEKLHQQRVIFESASFSLPAILPQFDCFSEFIVNEVNGFLYDAEDHDGLYHLILKLEGNRSLLRMAGRNAKKSLTEIHAYESYCVNLISHTSNVIKSK